MTQLKSQLLGLLLAMATAIGCIFYEKIVSNFSYVTIWLIILIEMLLLFVCSYFIFGHELKKDYVKFISEPKYVWWALAYMCTGVTGLCWFYITKKQGIMVGSIYEVKYIIIMALIYIAFGENKFTLNTAIGVALALGSIYYISKK